MISNLRVPLSFAPVERLFSIAEKYLGQTDVDLQMKHLKDSCLSDITRISITKLLLLIVAHSAQCA